MLHSNTSTSSFKLQPAPPPKSRKRPQNPPPLDLSASHNTPDDALQSCFSEDPLSPSTPKASLFNPPRRERSSTTSIASITSSSNSVSRLLATLSSPRHSSPGTQTLTVMLSNTSPTPSSPLFPRRTLLRTLSASCLSPTSPSPNSALRKRMGWRGALSKQLSDETAILLSPGSPLTPRRAGELHTPTQSSIASVLVPEGEEGEVEPLSATLKRIGAKRSTQRFEPEAVQSPVSGGNLTADIRTATRKIFHLPTWVRFEANHHARTGAAERNREAAAEFASLPLKPSTSPQPPPVYGVETLPKVSQLGDVAPSSPNGELFSGFDCPLSHSEEKEGEEWVVKIVKRPTIATLRDEKKGKGFGFRSALAGGLGWRRIKGPPCPKPPEGKEGDGWGGLSRSSWFPGQTQGPLVSPKPRGLKKLMLPSKVDKGEEGEWEDIQEPSLGASPDPKSFLELEGAPRFFNAPPAPEPWFRLPLSRPKEPLFEGG